MSTPLLPSFRRQQRLLDFAALEQACPEGIYLSLSPGDPSLWSGVLFVRSGPYESAVLRFDLLFPAAYPVVPPVVTFSSDIFHPLVVPLTTYMFSAGALDAAGTVSASDEDRLPPGSISLRYGFPDWYKRAGSLRSSLASDQSRPENEDHKSVLTEEQGARDHHHDQVTNDSPSMTLKVLEHMKAVFEDPEVIDAAPLEAAGNPSAWHAWRAHRGPSHSQVGGRGRRADSPRAPASPQQPGDWNWDGVWESRVRDGIEGSNNEATLYTVASHIRFSKLEPEQLVAIRETAGPT